MIALRFLLQPLVVCSLPMLMVWQESCEALCVESHVLQCTVAFANFALLRNSNVSERVAVPLRVTFLPAPGPSGASLTDRRC